MTLNLPTLHIGLVAGEVSGDQLGAVLMRDLKQKYPNIRFSGIGGPQMIKEGLHSYFPLEILSVMGIAEVFARLRQLFKVRDRLVYYWQQQPIDLFIGIDAPDFNLRLAKILKQQLNYKTVQYVSPSVWAWRQKRIHGIKAAVDLVLCLLPFEVEFYQQHQTPAIFVGHPLADQIPLEDQRHAAINQLMLKLDTRYISLLPGSRHSEIERLAPILFDSIQWLINHNQLGQYQILIPAINANIAQQLRTILTGYDQKVIDVVQILTDDQHIGRQAMAASDFVIIASGTATLECLMLHRPMIVIYKIHWLSYWIIKRMIKTPWVALPNIIAQRSIAPELLQKDANAKNIAQHLRSLINTEAGAQQAQQLTQIHQHLIADQSRQSPAQAILNLISTP